MNYKATRTVPGSPRARVLALAVVVALVGGLAMMREMLRDEAGPPLAVYGPGGPYEPVRACAENFSREFGIPVTVVKGQPEAIAQRVATDGDVYYGGAPYMMDDFIRAHPGVVDASTVRELFSRRVGIIVRRDNPKGIRGVADLSRPGGAVLDVALENMEALRGDPPGGGADVGRRVVSGEEGFAAWEGDPGLDAWVTYRSWFVRMTHGEEFLPIAGPDALRATPVALTRRTQRRADAMAFVDYLATDAAHRVFQEYGWE
jgi:accessory colonization factor AcfC